MVKSMTGFGKGEAALQNKKITVEIRSLNSKQLDLGLRLPAVYRQSEYEIRNIIARTIQRGKVDVFVTVESQAVETPARINKEVFREYLHQMTDTLAFAGIDADYDAIVPVIMRLPEVISTETESISDEEHAALIAATEAAAARLDAFRMQEGAILIADLLGRVDRIESYKEEVVPFEKARTETIKARILDNLEKAAGRRGPQQAGAGDDLLPRKARHHRREGPPCEPLQILPRSGRGRRGRRPQTGLHRAGNGP